MQAWLLQSGGGGRYDQTVTEVNLKGDRGVEERRVVQPRECRPHSNPGGRRRGDGARLHGIWKVKLVVKLVVMVTGQQRRRKEEETRVLLGLPTHLTR